MVADNPNMPIPPPRGTWSAYLVVATWPDGKEGLLFPRPGNVPLAETPEQGQKDFETACDHLREYIAKAGLGAAYKGTVLRLIRFEWREVVAEFRG